jgi:two-component system response regulator AlgR
MNVMLVDDEPLARARLRRLLLSYPQIRIVAEAENAQQALHLFKDHRPHAVFLDMEMPDKHGLEVAAMLRQQAPELAIIFVTAHKEHALDAYQVAPLDYLLKPITPERLALCIARLPLQETPAVIETPAHLVPARKGTLVTRLDLRHVWYLQAEDKYVNAVIGTEQWLLELSLKQIEEQFPSQWLRLHRQTLVNPLFCQGIRLNSAGKACVVMPDQQQLLVSRRELPHVRTMLLACD